MFAEQRRVYINPSILVSHIYYKRVNPGLLELYYAVNSRAAALITDSFDGSFFKCILHLNSSILSLISLPWLFYNAPLDKKGIEYANTGEPSQDAIRQVRSIYPVAPIVGGMRIPGGWEPTLAQLRYTIRK